MRCIFIIWRRNQVLVGVSDLYLEGSMIHIRKWRYMGFFFCFFFFFYNLCLIWQYLYTFIICWNSQVFISRYLGILTFQNIIKTCNIKYIFQCNILFYFGFNSVHLFFIHWIFIKYNCRSYMAAWNIANTA